MICKIAVKVKAFNKIKQEITPEMQKALDKLDKQGRLSVYDVMRQPRLKEIEEIELPKETEPEEIDYRKLNTRMTDALMSDFREKYEGQTEEETIEQTASPFVKPKVEEKQENPVEETESVGLSAKEKKQMDFLLSKVDANLLKNLEARHLVYNYDNLQLTKALEGLILNKSDKIFVVNLVGVIVKKNQFKDYLLPVFDKVNRYIDSVWDSLPTSYKVSYLYSLVKMNREKDSLYVLEKIRALNYLQAYKEMELRTIANYVWALSKWQRNNRKVTLKSLFDDLEPVLLTSLRTADSLDGTDLTNIVQAYCTTQNGSADLFILLSQIIEERSSSLSPQNIAILLYSFANNPDCSDRLLEALKPLVITRLWHFNSKEVCNLARAYQMRNMLDYKLEQNLKRAFSNRHVSANALDVSYLLSILGGSDETRADKRFNKDCAIVLDTLMHRITGPNLSVLMKRASWIQETFPELFVKLEKRIYRLMKRKNIKPYDVYQIYEQADSIKFEGEFNIFKEKLENYLSKNKYYIK